MTNISWNEVQDRAAEFASKWQGETYEKGESQSFWSDFLSIYGIDRRRHGAFFEYAIKKGSGGQGFIDMFWPGKLLAEQKSGGKDLTKANLQAYEYLETMPDHDLPRAIVVSDFTSFVFIDNETNDKTEFVLADLPRNVKLFAFLVGEDSHKTAEEQPVNRQAAEAMARLHNQLRDDNYTGHDLEVLLVRLVFCMFADDSGIFEHGQLRDYIMRRTSDDGSDLGSRLVQIFETLNTPTEQRQSSLDEDVASLPYVNGGLFAESIRAPYFSSAMRRDLLKAMELDWAQVSPAIFGSMFQGVMDEKERRNLGAHYTSEKNILRVIKPLFLDELYDEFARVRRSPKRLAEFHNKLTHLTFLDPACGCGNFLVITYRELRRLEHKVVDMLSKDKNTVDMLATSEAGKLKVNVDQMYGIEIEEFPSLIAQTALWLTDHQMNMEYSHLSGTTFKRLPLKASATIVNDNALTRDWAEIIAPEKLSYILGNPPFVGSKMMTPQMRRELLGQFQGVSRTGTLDYVCAWYAQAAHVMQINKRIQAAFVSTNSITQGEQVQVLWNYLYNHGIAITFAHRTFKWTNDAKGKAAVYCVIIGFGRYVPFPRKLFWYEDVNEEPVEVQAKNISPYLLDIPGTTQTINLGTGRVIVDDVPPLISSRKLPISDVPRIQKGNQPTDGGNLILSEVEKDELIKNEPLAAKYIKTLIGSKELIQGSVRYCLWLVDCLPSELRKMPLVLERVAKVREMRKLSTDPATRELANSPTIFRETRNPKSFIAIPSVSSERRSYVPMGFFDSRTISTNLNLIIENANLYHFGILTSQMHMAWMRAVAGRLKSDYRYSKDIVYNNFIWPEATDAQKAEIEKLAQSVLDARVEFPEASLADLYDPLTMPPVLARAHRTLDRAVDKLYSPKPFASDAERVAMLFELYQKAS